VDLNSINIERNLKGGYNCIVYKGYYDSQNTKKDVVVKVMEAVTGIESLMGTIKNNYLNIREKARREGVVVPVLYDCYILRADEVPIKFGHCSGWSFIIVESYAGISVKDLIRIENYSMSKTKRIIAECKDFINKLPEDIPLDTNPGNIVYSDINNELSYVDFLPPDPWAYTKDYALRKDMEKIFPTLKNTLDDDFSLNRYFKNVYRWEKFKYYLHKYVVTYKSAVLP
jgi:hypothetical protein